MWQYLKYIILYIGNFQRKHTDFFKYNTKYWKNIVPIAPDGPIGGREAMEPWDYPRAMEGRRITSMAIGGHAWLTLHFTV